jgi:hypothetical protein
VCSRPDGGMQKFTAKIVSAALYTLDFKNYNQRPAIMKYINEN